MNRTTRSLTTLLCISAASLTYSLSRDGALAEAPPVAPAVRKAFDAAVQKQVLAHLNPPASPREHLSRVMRPVPSRSYAARIVAASGDELLIFEIVHLDRSRLRAGEPSPVTTVVGQGRFRPTDRSLELWDDGRDAYVPASQHPLLGARGTVG